MIDGGGGIVKDIPLFTTQVGVSSLFLKNIPFTRSAYIKLQSFNDPVELLRESVAFCRMAGAERIFASGYDMKQYNLHTTIFQMYIRKDRLPQTAAVLCPVSPETMEQWRKIYNEKMKDVPNSARISVADAKHYLENSNCYFVFLDNGCIGIGVAGGDRIEALAGCVPGAGRDVLLALSAAVTGQCVWVSVSDRNISAMRLYEGLGFAKTEDVERWYQII